jgi:hypothetical protein
MRVYFGKRPVVGVVPTAGHFSRELTACVSPRINASHAATFGAIACRAAAGERRAVKAAARQARKAAERELDAKHEADAAAELDSSGSEQRAGSPQRAKLVRGPVVFASARGAFSSMRQLTLLYVASTLV